MFAVIVNTLTVLIGSAVGLFLKKGIPQKLADAVMLGISLCTLYIGIDGTLKGENTIVLILSMVLGAVIGTALDIDGAINRLGRRIEDRFSGRDGKVPVAQGFVTACLLFCVGAMTIVGSLNAGLTGDYEMLLTKSVLDLISSMMLSVSLGVGVMFAAAFVLVFQGGLVLLAGCLQPLLTAAAVNEIVCAGSLLIVGLGLNLLGLSKIKVADYLPALVIAPILCRIIECVPALAAFFG